MESFVPFPAPPERGSDLGHSKPKTRWNFFEMFKKQHEIDRVEHSQRLAATAMSLLRGNHGELRTAAPEDTQAFTGEEVLTAERVTRPLNNRERIAGQPTLVEPAKEMGRGVLRMISRANTEIRDADARERTHPTDLQPLVIADADIRAAMKELIAPIEALQKPASQEVADTIQAAVLGGDHNPSVLLEQKTPFARTLEVAAAVAGVTAREMLYAKERTLAHTRIVQKVGSVALGGTTVRRTPAGEEQRLHELESVNVQELTRPERRRYVKDISEFAHKQAAGIRKAAREVVSRPELTPVVGASPVSQTQQPGITPRRQSAYSWLGGFMLGVTVVIILMLWSMRIL